jgi:hypothetical protein
LCLMDYIGVQYMINVENVTLIIVKYVIIKNVKYVKIIINII